MEVKTIIENFKNELIIYEKSNTTIKNYMKFLNKFIKDNNIKKVDDFKILEDYCFYTEYIKMLKERNNCSDTINCRLSVLSSFCNYLKGCRIISDNIVRCIPKLPSSNKGVTFLNDKEIQLVLNAMKKRIYIEHKRHIDEINAYREYLMVAIMVSLGVRVSEVCNILVKDIDSNNNTIAIRGKGYGGKISHILNIPENLISIMEEWEQLRETIDIDCASQDYYFVSALTKKHVKPLSIEKRLHQLEEELGIENLHPHKLRHSFATNSLHNNRLTLNEVSDILNHSSTITTERYYIARDKKALRKTAYASSHLVF